jgi:hypothetical protein
MKGIIFRIIDESDEYLVKKHKEFRGFLMFDEDVLANSCVSEEEVKITLKAIMNTFKQTYSNNWDVYDIMKCLPSKWKCQCFVDEDYEDRVIKLEKDDKE